jgi:uncharacterized protein (DUF305 family)
VTRLGWTLLALGGALIVGAGVIARISGFTGGGRGEQAIPWDLDDSTALDEQAFLEAMIPHHRLGAEMARIALERTGRPEIRLLAHNTVASSEDEIAHMRSWQRARFTLGPTAIATSGHDPMEGIRQGAIDPGDLEACHDDDFDSTFLSMLIAHRAAAIVMAENVLMSGPREEIRLMAEHISATHAAEVGEMQRWRDAWFLPMREESV